MTERPLRRKNGEVVNYKRGPKKGKPIMTLKADAWFHDFRRTAIRNLNGGAFLGRWQSSWSDTRGIAFMSDTMSRVSVIWMWPERRWNVMERLYSTSNPHPNSHHFARDGQSLGKVYEIS